MLREIIGRLITERRRDTILVVIVVVLTGLVTYTVTRLSATYANARAIAVLEAKVESLQGDLAAHDAAVREWQKEIYGSLFGAVAEAQAKAAPRRPLSIESWMGNRFKSVDDKNREQDGRLRDHDGRLSRLERENDRMH